MFGLGHYHVIFFAKTKVLVPLCTLLPALLLLFLVITAVCLRPGHVSAIAVNTLLHSVAGALGIALAL